MCAIKVFGEFYILIALNLATVLCCIRVCVFVIHERITWTMMMAKTTTTTKKSHSNWSTLTFFVHRQVLRRLFSRCVRCCCFPFDDAYRAYLVLQIRWLLLILVIFFLSMSVYCVRFDRFSSFYCVLAVDYKRLSNLYSKYVIETLAVVLTWIWHNIRCV